MKKIMLLILIIILLASASAQTSCEKCKAIDDAWKDIIPLLNLREQTYNPDTSSWQDITPTIPTTPAPASNVLSTFSQTMTAMQIYLILNEIQPLSEKLVDDGTFQHKKINSDDWVIQPLPIGLETIPTLTDTELADYIKEEKLEKGITVTIINGSLIS